MSQTITPAGPVYQELVACLREIADVSRKHKDKTASYQALGMEVLARRMLARIPHATAQTIPAYYAHNWSNCNCPVCEFKRRQKIGMY